MVKIFYLKFLDGEVDFILKEGEKIKQLIQVTYASARNEIERREIKSLMKGKTIKCIPLWKWLLTYHGK